MIDLKELRQRKEEIQNNITVRNMQVDLEEILLLQDKRASLIQENEDLRMQRNENAKKMKGKLSQEERSLLIQEGKRLKEAIGNIDHTLTLTEKDYYKSAAQIPNYAHPSAPIGKEDKDNLELKRSGDIPIFNFKAKDHVELGTALDLIDFETAAQVSGTKFYYLKNDAVILDLALQRYTMDILRKHGFTLTITPDIAKETVVEGIGFNPRGSESNIYTIEDTGTCLVGTAEITLGGYYAGKIFDAEELPIKLAGLSHCFRREAGASGQYSKGLYRVHQFTKIEMFVYALPEESERIHEELLSVEEEIFQGLEIPYRVVDTCTGDLGAPAYRKYDIEAWMPGRGDSGDWGEITSASNCTDYQARRLGSRYRSNGKIQFVHMLNGTAIAISRSLIAILENFQQEDGSVRIPKNLIPYTGFETIQAAKN
ncbi:MAG: serine--tRNA ligase [Bacteroidetes bacterium]|nr:serine--tRNA ligase [Bacteroidota bacterium]